MDDEDSRGASPTPACAASTYAYRLRVGVLVYADRVGLSKGKPPKTDQERMQAIIYDSPMNVSGPAWKTPSARF